MGGRVVCLERPEWMEPGGGEGCEPTALMAVLATGRDGQ